MNEAIVQKGKEEKKEKFLSKYINLFWFFMIGNVSGVVVEGIICLFSKHQWESHVTLLRGPFNLVYGFAAVFLYIISKRLNGKSEIFKFAVFSILCTTLELAVAIFQERFFHSTSWDYSGLPLNILGGRLCLLFSIGWGVLGITFSKFIFTPLDKAFRKKHSKRLVVVSVALSVMMMFNILFSTAVIYRWGNRTVKPVPTNKFEIFVDVLYPDDYMQSRFCEWKLIDKT